MECRGSWRRVMTIYCEKLVGALREATVVIELRPQPSINLTSSMLIHYVHISGGFLPRLFTADIALRKTPAEHDFSDAKQLINSQGFDHDIQGPTTWDLQSSHVIGVPEVSLIGIRSIAVQVIGIHCPSTHRHRLADSSTAVAMMVIKQTAYHANSQAQVSTIRPYQVCRSRFAETIRSCMSINGSVRKGG